jgi:hypothetical protein
MACTTQRSAFPMTRRLEMAIVSITAILCIERPSKTAGAMVAMALAVRGKSHPWPFSTCATPQKAEVGVAKRRILRRQAFSTAC